MKISIDFESGSAVAEAFRLKSYRADIEPTDRLKNLNRDILQRVDKHMPKEAAQEVRKMLTNLNHEAARIGCLNGFEHCAGIVTEKTAQMHRKGDFSDRARTSFCNGEDDSFRYDRHSGGGYDRDRRSGRW